MPKILSDSRDPMKAALGAKLRQMKKEDPEKLQEVLMNMTDQEAKEILYDFEIWCRPEQWIDLSEPQPTTIILSGRGLT